MLFFGGMLVDPGYGLQEDNGEPLYFHIANVGAEPLVLRPGTDAVASIAFLEVNAPPSEELRDPEKFGVVAPKKAKDELFGWDSKNEPTGALALVEDQRELGDRLSRLEATLGHVVMLGVVVLAVTLLAAITSALLSFDASSR